MIVLAAMVLARTILALLTGPETGPFLKEVSHTTWIIGNDVWNVTQGRTYATKLWYKDRDCVGSAVGHYVSYSKSRPGNMLARKQAQAD
jgi:rhamnogalacturonan endolyase